MTKKIAFFFPHNPYPPDSGCNKRCLEILEGLKELDYKVTFISSPITASNTWTDSSIQVLQTHWVDKVLIYEPKHSDLRYLAITNLVSSQLKINPLFNSFIKVTPNLKSWFQKTLQEVLPDVLIMNYHYWDSIIDHNQVNGIRKIIDTHDIQTMQMQMRKSLEKYFDWNQIPGLKPVSSAVLRESFYDDKLNIKKASREFKIYDKYDFSIAISANETKLIKENTHKTKVVYLPMTYSVHQFKNSYSSPPLFTMGPNPFNFQAYFYFTKRVLPLILRKIPDFSLQVTSTSTLQLEPEKGIILSGFVPDLQALYQSASFVICPVFGGTGQQVKVVEAMAHGLPVVGLRSVVERSTLKHDVNGLVADTAEEFAEHVIQLYNNRMLCAKLGQGARETVIRECSRTLLLEGLQEMIDLPSHGSLSQLP